jgi:ribosomal protein L11 methylase PrmA
MIDTTEAQRHPASFRDPSGFIYKRDRCTLRQVNQCYRDNYEHLMASGLYEELVDAELLLPHEEAPGDCNFDSFAYKVLRPAQLAFVSYPYEWSFSQLRHSAAVTLEIQKRALAKGMSLKDASAFNVQLHAGRLKLIDTLSFERFQVGRPWIAYRQFCQHFLAPLALACQTDVRLNQLSRIYIDGVPLDLASRLLPWRSRFNLSLGLHIHAHARSQQKHAAASTSASKVPNFSRRNFEAILAGLANTVAGLKWNSPATQWADYYEANHNYGSAGMESKDILIRDFISQVKPRTVWDLGANNGRFSRIAARCGAKTVVAWDIDPACVDEHYQQVIKQKEVAIHPLLLDLTNPTPGIGWANCERSSFAERGSVDAILALGLIHHLAVSNNVPLGQIARFFATLSRWAIVEWIPKHDSQFQRLLNGRDDIFADYGQQQFEKEFGHYFILERTERVKGTERSLYLMQSNA